MPREQLVLFAQSLEERIPEDHPVRMLDEILDQVDWSEWESGYHGKVGQPPIHPSVLCKVLLFAMIRRVRSSRQMEYQIRHSVDFIWLTSGRQIDHTTLSEFRRNHPKQLKALYRQIVQLAIQCKQEGIDPKKSPARLPKNDHGSRILPNKEGGYAPNYTPMAVVETQSGFIVGADVLIGNVEHTVLMAMLDTIEADYETKVETVLADTAYSTGPNLQAAEERGLELLSPAITQDTKDNPAFREDLSQPVAEDQVALLPLNSQSQGFDKQAFIYEEAHDRYRCPAGKMLTRCGSENVKKAGATFRRVRYRCHECSGCPLIARCQPKGKAKRGRGVTRDDFEAVRERHRKRMAQEESKTRYKRRSHFGETPFAVLKSPMDLRRFLLRGVTKVQQEWLWGCTGFNLKKLMRMWEALRD